jgi:hypothetical protein
MRELDPAYLIFREAAALLNPVRRQAADLAADKILAALSDSKNGQSIFARGQRLSWPNEPWPHVALPHFSLAVSSSQID